MGQLRMGAVLLHSAAAAIMVHGYRSLRNVPFDAFIRTQKGGHGQFLTIIGLFMAVITMVSGLGSDLFPSLPIFRTVKRTVLMIALPVATVVTTVYWSLIFFAEELILRPMAQGKVPQPDESVPSSAGPTQLQRIPLSTDLALHAAPALALLLDFYLIERKYTRAQAIYGGILLTAIAGVLYASWTEYLAQFNGSFPYPFLTENPFDVRVIIYVVLSIFALVTFWFMNALHS
ncbi:hypothetical protein WOLCODRAFT_136059 [Wolfiporia cocos MD-104 SS10]|uniref:FAR-17a/AIG1-like protein n=1 Tax=Wolfiporia cocos (strain MD-104) TaxID=742152 RepID=A0A2H3JH80_WOLCO|nr:hypothetical protein WOLCODRAFT_136059 [Wolfiporia cocos MD-104 SS10]